MSHSLYPGCIIDIPVTDVPDDTNPTSSSEVSPPLPSSSSPKHTFVQDEEEPIPHNSSQVWSGPSTDIEVPIVSSGKPTNVVPVLADDIVPVPAVDTDTGPRQSARSHIPSNKAAENSGINHIPHIAQVVIESCDAGHRLKEQHAQAKFERCLHILDLRATTMNVDSTVSPPIITNAIPDDSLPPLPILDPEADFVAFCEAYAVELASPLINPHNPDEPTFREAMNSPDSDKWILGSVYKLVPCSDVPTGHKVLHGKWVLLLKCDENGNPV